MTARFLEAVARAGSAKGMLENNRSIRGTVA
jgi:hypothetical protein